MILRGELARDTGAAVDPCNTTAASGATTCDVSASAPPVQARDDVVHPAVLQERHSEAVVGPRSRPIRSEPHNPPALAPCTRTCCKPPLDGIGVVHTSSTSSRSSSSLFFAFCGNGSPDLSRDACDGLRQTRAQPADRQLGRRRVTSEGLHRCHRTSGPSVRARRPAAWAWHKARTASSTRECKHSCRLAGGRGVLADA